MLGFTPFKKHANEFEYTPRYYDPDRERRERRRAELRGETSETAEGEYTPGQYLRTAHSYRAARRDADSRRAAAGRRRLWMMMGGAVVVLLFIAFLYPKAVALLTGASRQAAAPAAVSTAERPEPADAFDQSHISDTEWSETSIRIVPNE